MQVYDTANKLAEEIKNSECYINLKESKEKLFQDPEKKKMIEDFEKLKQEVQIMEVKREQNQPIDENEKKILNNILIMKLCLTK